MESGLADAAVAVLLPACFNTIAALTSRERKQFEHEKKSGSRTGRQQQSPEHHFHIGESGRKLRKLVCQGQTEAGLVQDAIRQLGEEPEAKAFP
jgi:hypothetical protein